MDLHDWAAACAHAMRTGQRMLTLYGRRESADQALVTAVLLCEPGGMAILRSRGPIAQGYPSLTAEFPLEGVNESGVAEQRAGTGPIKAQSTAVARATASICNAEWRHLQGTSGHVDCFSASQARLQNAHGNLAETMPGTLASAPPRRLSASQRCTSGHQG